jgi:hypothetical protein
MSPPASRTAVAAGLGAAVAAASALLALALLSAYQPLSERFAAAGVGGAALLALAAGPLVLRPALPARPWLSWLPLLPLLLLAVNAVNTLWARVPLLEYGDNFHIRQFLHDGTRFPRWLAGTTLAGGAYALVRELQGAGPGGAPDVAGLRTFVALAGGACACAGGVWAARFRRTRLAVALSLLLPLQLSFALGYQEYYPFVAGFLLAALAWAFDADLRTRTPLQLGGVAVLLPVLYLGLLPLGALLLACAFLTGWRRGLQACAWAALAGLVLVWGLSGTPPPVFFAELEQAMNLGDRNTLHPPYVGQAAGPGSTMFRASFALGAQHLREVAYLVAHGAGWLPLLLLPAAAVAAAGSARLRRGALREPRLALGALLAGFELYYLVFMMPKLGPHDDVDLFFHVYVVLTFLAGLLLHRLLEAPGRPPLAAHLLLCAALGNAAVHTALLLRVGFPPLAAG